MRSEPAVIDQELDPLVGVFRLLSDKTRLNILLLLAAGERNVSSLCEELDLPQPTVSHHLGLLRMQNLISNRRNGKQVFYGLNGHVNGSEGDGLQINVDRFNLQIGVRND
ncbi:MAG TPA: metalloregulator ArsR/SmtB family transcription factor [Tepidisphaeraceae bacterium]|jgi:DNA-binding transcriptional ArsR family regulator|nr:metalloregulator ArsR/SmtB family transcription factor [Tepidisphaeraceae bacterium]